MTSVQTSEASELALKNLSEVDKQPKTNPEISAKILNNVIRCYSELEKYQEAQG